MQTNAFFIPLFLNQNLVKRAPLFNAAQEQVKKKQKETKSKRETVTLRLIFKDKLSLRCLLLN